MEIEWCQTNMSRRRKKGEPIKRMHGVETSTGVTAGEVFWARIGIALGRENEITTENTVVT